MFVNFFLSAQFSHFHLVQSLNFDDLGFAFIDFLFVIEENESLFSVNFYFRFHEIVCEKPTIIQIANSSLKKDA